MDEDHTARPARGRPRHGSGLDKDAASAQHGHAGRHDRFSSCAGSVTGGTVSPEGGRRRLRAATSSLRLLDSQPQPPELSWRAIAGFRVAYIDSVACGSVLALGRVIPPGRNLRCCGWSMLPPPGKVSGRLRTALAYVPWFVRLPRNACPGRPGWRASEPFEEGRASRPDGTDAAIRRVDPTASS